MVGEELALVDGRPQTIAEWGESGSCEHCHSFWVSYIFFSKPLLCLGYFQILVSCLIKAELKN